MSFVTIKINYKDQHCDFDCPYLSRGDCSLFHDGHFLTYDDSVELYKRKKKCIEATLQEDEQNGE